MEPGTPVAETTPLRPDEKLRRTTLSFGRKSSFLRKKD